MLYKKTLWKHVLIDSDKVLVSRPREAVLIILKMEQPVAKHFVIAAENAAWKIISA
jgi:hypothetical protein